jgi:hypothetical protein
MICLFLTVVLCFSLLPSAALASEATATPCYIASSDCPEAYIEFARENISKFVMSITENLPESRFSVGTPFAFAAQDADIYYFPVIANGKIKYLFRVYPSGDGFGCAITEFLAAELNELAPLTSAGSPMYLKLVDDCIVATIGSQTYELFKYPVSMSDDTESTVLSTAAEYPARNVTASSNIALNLQPARNVSNYIPLNIIEKQGSANYWCTAYCLAAIVRTTTGSYTTAQQLMIDAVGSNPDTQQPFPWGNSDEGVILRRVAGLYGLHPITTTTPASNSVLFQEILANRPYIAAMQTNRAIGEENEYHSIVVRGWDHTAGILSIWNPWDYYYENYSVHEAYVPTGRDPVEDAFTPYKHAYNFWVDSN